MEPTLNIGQSFSHYKILSHLGAGGMGEVWLARDSQLDRRVALKILPERFTQDALLVRRFIQEARAASALNHPNIITIYEIGQFGATHFIATEYVEGRTLREQIGQEGLSLDAAVDVAAQVAGALAAAHAAGIIHRDIKPENVMLRPDGLVKVLDFGLAKLTAQRPPGIPGSRDASDEIDTEAATALKLYTGPNAILGTTSYMSPEQARGEEIDGRSDCFSLGVVLYEMLARRRPFNGRTTIEILAAILEREPEPLATHAPDVPRELRYIVTTALSKDAAERQQSAREFADELKSFKTEREFSLRSGRITGETEPLKTVKMEPVASQQLTPPPVSMPHTMPHTVPRTMPRWTWVAAPALLLLVVAMWWLSARRNEMRAPVALKTVEVANWRGAPGEVYSAGSLSPDGKLVAFAQAEGEGANIWIKAVATSRANQATKDQFSNLSPVWSPEGDELAFFSNRGYQSALWRMPAPFGGPPTMIVQLANTTPKLLYWSPRGRLYYIAEQKLFAYDFNAGRSETINLPAKTPMRGLSIAPDEAQVAWVETGKDGRGSVWAMALGGNNGQPVRVAEHAAACKNTAWAADSRRVLYSAQVDGTFQIFAAPTDSPGGAPTQLTFGEQDALVLAVARDGTKVLYGWSKEEADIWAVDVATGAETALTSDISFELWPEVAPDGKTIAFQAVRNLSQGDKLAFSSLMIKTIGADNSETQAQPMPIAAHASLPRWSPDGARLVFLREQGGAFNLWTVQAEGGDERQLTRGGVLPVAHTVLPYLRHQSADFSWSPDGTRIAYQSDRGGQNNLWVVAADGANETALTDNRDANLFLSAPLWSADGGRLAHAARQRATAQGQANNFSISVVEVATRTSRVVFQSETFARLLGWLEGDKELLVAALPDSRIGFGTPTTVTLLRVPVGGGAPQPIATLPSAYLYNIQLAPDRRSIAFTARREGKDKAWMIPARGGAARKLTNNNDPGLYFSSLAWSPDGKTIYFGKQSRHSLLSMLTGFE